MIGRSLWARLLAVGATLAVVACGSQQASNSSTTTDTGITKDTISLGATYPISGSASAYYSIAKGANAYFQYINSKGGVAGGRKISYTVVDDGYQPANTPAKARELVEQDNVFATFGNLGTAPNLAVRDYYNQQKVPDMFVFTGSSHWGADFSQYPWTTGWQPAYPSEGKIYGQYILKNEPQDKIAILYQNDDYGKDYVTGIKAGLGDKASSMIVATATYNSSDPVELSSQVNQLKASGADTFYVVAVPAYAANAVTDAVKSGWKAKIYMNSVANSSATWKKVVQSLGSANALDGMISVVYIKDPLDSQWSNDQGVQLFKQVMTQYGNGCDATGADSFCVVGMACAYTLVQVLNQAYKDGKLTRQHVADIAGSNMHYSDNPLLLPGIVVKTTSSDHFPIQQEKLEKWQGDHWVAFGDLFDARPGGSK